jgi:hypothetical protein
MPVEVKWRMCTEKMPVMFFVFVPKIIKTPVGSQIMKGGNLREKFLNYYGKPINNGALNGRSF